MKIIKDQNVFVKVSQTEKQTFLKLAKLREMSLSELVRSRLKSEAEKVGLWPIKAEVE